LDDRKITSGVSFFLCDCLVASHSKKNESVSPSISKVEYIANTSCFTQLLWMAQTLSNMGITISKPISIFCDNTSSIHISKNLVMHSYTKTISIKFHFIWEKVLANEVCLQFVASQE
jgi:hypothetical protein